MEINNALVTQEICGVDYGVGDGGYDAQVFWAPPMRDSGMDYSGRRGRGRGRGSGRGRGRVLPPPFLNKIYKMVDDPDTNSIISWGSNNRSFIILDQISFAAQILPKYFKHSNFSSFVYQLNNYGFRKISWDRLEYENPWFQAGKEQWLPNITRRHQQFDPENSPHLTPHSDDFEEVRMEMEFETLRSEQNNLQLEIQNLREQQEEMDNQLKSFKESTIFTDGKHEDMVIPLLAQQFMQYLKEKRKMDCAKKAKKQQKMDPSAGSDDDDDGKNQVQEELHEMLPEREINSSSPEDFGGSNNKEKKDVTSSGTDENIAFWKKILEDDSETENENGGREEKLQEYHPNIMIRLEDLMAAATCPNEDENFNKSEENNDQTISP